MKLTTLWQRMKDEAEIEPNRDFLDCCFCDKRGRRKAKVKQQINIEFVKYLDELKNCSDVE